MWNLLQLLIKTLCKVGTWWSFQKLKQHSLGSSKSNKREETVSKLQHSMICAILETSQNTVLSGTKRGRLLSGCYLSCYVKGGLWVTRWQGREAGFLQEEESTSSMNSHGFPMMVPMGTFSLFWKFNSVGLSIDYSEVAFWYESSYIHRDGHSL